MRPRNHKVVKQQISTLPRLKRFNNTTLFITVIAMSLLTGLSWNFMETKLAELGTSTFTISMSVGLVTSICWTYLYHQLTKKPNELRRVNADVEEDSPIQTNKHELTKGHTKSLDKGRKIIEIPRTVMMRRGEYKSKHENVKARYSLTGLKNLYLATKITANNMFSMIIKNMAKFKALPKNKSNDQQASTFASLKIKTDQPRVSATSQNKTNSAAIIKADKQQVENKYDQYKEIYDDTSSEEDACANHSPENSVKEEKKNTSNSPRPSTTTIILASTQAPSQASSTFPTPTCINAEEKVSALSTSNQEVHAEVKTMPSDPQIIPTNIQYSNNVLVPNNPEFQNLNHKIEQELILYKMHLELTQQSLSRSEATISEHANKIKQIEALLNVNEENKGDISSSFDPHINNLLRKIQTVMKSINIGKQHAALNPHLINVPNGNEGNLYTETQHLAGLYTELGAALSRSKVITASAPTESPYRNTM